MEMPKMTGGGLKKKDLKYNKQGKIVSKKMSAIAKKEKRLQKAGYTTVKGQFGAVRIMKGGDDTSHGEFKNIDMKIGSGNTWTPVHGIRLYSDFNNNKYITFIIKNKSKYGSGNVETGKGSLTNPRVIRYRSALIDKKYFNCVTDVPDGEGEIYQNCEGITVTRQYKSLPKVFGEKKINRADLMCAHKEIMKIHFGNNDKGPATKEAFISEVNNVGPVRNNGNDPGNGTS
jgi:hypothetical protein